MKYKMTRSYKELELSSGAVVHCRPVPPYMIGSVTAKFTEPAYPYIDESSIAGGSERRPALIGTEQWNRWQSEMKEYRKKMGSAVMDFSLSYGIVDWRFPDMDEFVKEPPDDWQVPEELVQLTGERTSSDAAIRRTQFIKFELLLTNEDADKVEAVTTRPSQPITREELKDAMSPFDSDAATAQP